MFDFRSWNVDLANATLHLSAVVSAVAALLYSYYAWRSVRRHDLIAGEVTKSLLEISSGTRGEMEFDNLLNEFSSGPLSSYASDEGIRRATLALQREIIDILDFACATLSSMVGKPVSASFKVMTKSSRENVLVTLARDTLSRSTREILDLEYPVRENLPFQLIVKEGLPVYVNNNIESLAEGGYENPRGAWNLVYKSTLVVPVKSLAEEGLVIGVLCFDSSEKNVFSTQSSEIASEIAKRLSVIMYRISTLGKIGDRMRN